MAITVRERVVVRNEGILEIRHPELPEGAEAEVIILLEPRQDIPPLGSFIGQGKGCFSSVEEVDAFLRSEREAWEE